MNKLVYALIGTVVAITTVIALVLMKRKKREDVIREAAGKTA